MKENQRYALLGLQALEEILTEGQNLKVYSHVTRLKHEFLAYQNLMQSIAPPLTDQERGQARRLVTPQQEEEMRERGKTLVDLSQYLVTFERQRM